MENKNFHYDDFSDQLLISCKKESNIMAGSVRMLNLILDLTTDDRVVNVELLRASEYLESLDIDSSILNNLSDASFVFKKLRTGYLINLILRTENQVVRIPCSILLKDYIPIEIS